MPPEAFKRPPREQQAWEEIGHTEVRPAVAWLLAAGLLAVLVAVPFVQTLAPAKERPFAELAAGLSELGRAKGGPLAINRALLERMHDFEATLERASWIQRSTRSEIQEVMTRWGGVGNEKVDLGRGGWLYFHDSFEYVFGPGFLEPEVLERRRRAAESWRELPHPDPVPAIVDLHRQLAERNIELVVMPVPPKAVLVPEGLSGGTGLETAAHNPSFAEFCHRLEAAGVEVFDPTEALRRSEQETGRETYLRTDSHWSPTGMGTVARELAAHLEERGLAGSAAITLERRAQRITTRGDLARLLELPSGSRAIAEETVEIERVSGGDGRAWKSDPAAEVLLLGDSFTNVFSLENLHWGTSAGLAEQLSFHLGRPVDRLAINAGGDAELRRRLAQELAAGNDRLAGKQVVIYQFAARELARGDWPLVELPEARSAPPPTAQIEVRGRITEIAELPDPGETPYRDALVAIRLDEVEALGAAAPAQEILVYAWGLRDARPAEAAGYRVGQRLELRLVPWAQAPAEIEGLQRLEPAGDDWLFLDAYWAVGDLGGSR